MNAPKVPFGYSPWQGRLLALVGDEYQHLTEPHAAHLLADLTAEMIACCDPFRRERIRIHADCLARAMAEMQAGQAPVERRRSQHIATKRGDA